MNKGAYKKRIYLDKHGHEHRVTYPNFSIIGYCNVRHMEMFFVKIDEDQKGHFVYSPAYAMQFEDKEDAESIIKAFKLKNCSVQPRFCDENSNLYPSTRIAHDNILFQDHCS